MRRLERFLHYIDTINDKVGRWTAYLLIPLSIIMITEVVARYIFNSPTIWAWDVNLQIFGIIILLGAGYVLLLGRHISIDAITMLLPPKGRLVLTLLAMLMLMYVAVVVVWQGGISGWDSFLAKAKLQSIWAPPIYHIWMLFPVGGLLLLLQGLAKFIRDLLALWRREE